MLKQLIVGLLGTAVASSGLAYAGAPLPNPVKEVVEVVSSNEQAPADVTPAATHDEPDSSAEPADLPDEAKAGKARAEENKAFAEAFTGAVKDWTGCVREAAAAHEASGSTDAFDPKAACGEHPHPRDFRSEDHPSSKAQQPETETGTEQEQRDDHEPDAGSGRPAHAGQGRPEGAGPPAR